MSDIYLAISETPTVVTLTSAVLNSAVASSVTVMNTVTVALDANSLSALENVTVTVGAAITGTVTVGNFPATQPVSIASVTIGSLPLIAGTVTAGGLWYDGAINIPTPFRVGEDGELYTISSLTNALPAGTNRIGVVTIGGGTVTIGAGTAIIGNIDGVNTVLAVQDGNGDVFGFDRNFPVDIMSALPTGTNRIGVVTIGGGTVTIGAGTAQIGSVTASISSFATSVTARLINPAGTAVTYAEVGTAGNPSIDVLSVQGVTAGTPLNVYPMQGTTVSNTNFTSTTASTSLVSAVTGREVLTVFNEGAGNLHISPGATATTISYQVRLSAGDYWECPQGQLSLGHVAVFATAGTARVCQVT